MSFGGVGSRGASGRSGRGHRPVLVAIVALLTSIVGVGSAATMAGASTGASRARPSLPATGMLRATTSPAVPAQILIDGVESDSWGLTWVHLTVGSHTISATHIEGYTDPAPQTVTITAGATTTITLPFVRRGTLRALTSPAVASTISVDGVPRDDWGLWTDLPAGSHSVCFGAVAGYAPPACKTATVTAGALTTITGAFTTSAGAAGPTGGMLRVTTSPSVPAQILVDGVLRDSSGLSWLHLAAGSHTVSGTHIEGFGDPSPQTVTVTNGATTTVTLGYTARGSLRVLTSPAVPSTIYVDGIPRDDWGLWTDLKNGLYNVCFREVAGYTTPPCQDADVIGGTLTTITAKFSIAGSTSLAFASDAGDFIGGGVTHTWTDTDGQFTEQTEGPGIGPLTRAPGGLVESEPIAANRGTTVRACR